MQPLADAPLPSLRLVDGREGGSRVEIRTRGGAGLVLAPLPAGPLRDPGALRWRWRVEEAPATADLRDPDRDDSPLRVFVAFGETAPTGIDDVERAIFYSWGSRRRAGARFPSHLSHRIGIRVLRSAEDLGGWHIERRDPFRDFREHFGEDPPPVTAVGFVADADQTGGRVRASLGEICWEAGSARDRRR